MSKLDRVGMDDETTKSVRARLPMGDVGALFALIAIVAFFAVVDSVWGEGHFWSVRNLRIVLTQTSIVAVAAMGMTMIIIAGGIDLSAGTALTLSATVMAFCLKSELPVVWVVLATLGVGCACGCLNGFLISTLRIVPFIVTLGTMTIFLGVGKIVSNESTIFPPRDQIPVWLMNLCSTRPPDMIAAGVPVWVLASVMLAVLFVFRSSIFGKRFTVPMAMWIVMCLTVAATAVWGVKLGVPLPNIPSGVWVAAFLALAVWSILRYTVFGRHVFALGSNESTARLCGINVPLTKLAVYTLAGLFVSVAAMYHFATLKIANPVEGLGLELKFIAAVVIGGGSLSGGRGSVLGTLAGATIMGVITSGCDQLEVPNPYQDIFIGAIIIAAVTLDRVRQSRIDAA